MSEILNDANFQKFRDLIYKESGIHFTHSNRSVLESRIRQSLREKKADTVEEFYQIISTNPESMKEFLDSVTTNLTRFFRNAAHFSAFERFVIPDIIKYKQENKSEKIVRIWSAGCSTGEEPYSLAITLEEKLPPDFTYKITASDLSLKSLLKAKEGFYQPNQISHVPENYLKKYFINAGNGYKIKDQIKEKIKFDYHNLKFDNSLNGLDIIFCRNVLIYFDESAQKAVVNRFWKALNNHSFLFIGHSESLFGMNTPFQFLKTPYACLYVKSDTKMGDSI